MTDCLYLQSGLQRASFTFTLDFEENCTRIVLYHFISYPLAQKVIPMIAAPGAAHPDAIPGNDRPEVEHRFLSELTFSSRFNLFQIIL
jgi:hypothetical protein